MANPNNAARQAGVLSVSAANAQGTAGNSQKSGRGKAPVEGQKVVIRRLPPGISEEEVSKYLGDEWQPNKGKVGWFSFMPGKTSTDLAKPSRPSRVYLHLLRTEYIMPFMDHVRNSQWEDASGTWGDPCLCGPPAMEISIYKKIPTSKNRADTRQGTIDQDPEFMTFLESLANPTGDRDPEADYTGQEDELPIVKASSTPLIEYLREKKANKAKEASISKSGKNSRHESQVGKAKGSDDPKRKSRDAKTERSGDRPRQNVKILTKKAATAAAVEAANNIASQISSASKDDASAKGGRRAGIAAAARILARDLGISPGNAHRKVRLARQEVEKAENDGKPATAENVSAAKETGEAAVPGTSAAAANANNARQSAATASKPTASSSRGSRGKRGASGTADAVPEATERKGRSRKAAADKPAETPATAPKAPMAILKRKDETTSGNSNSAPATASATAAAAAGPAPAKSTPTGPKASQGRGASGSAQKKGNATSGGSNSTRAFVKHANPSQGVTDAVLKEAMSTFGAVIFVEIDRRKGFAYVDFANHDGLAKAIAASPISVAQATVQVLERKDTNKKTLPAPASTGNTGSTKGNAASVPATATVTATVAPKATGGTKTEADTPASGSTPTDASKPAGDQKRGGRRRGGRGRGGDSNKDGAGNKGTGGGNKAASGPTGNAAAPASSGS